MPIPPPSDAKQVFNGILYQIYHAPREQFDGSTKTFEYLIRPDSVTIIPFISSDEVLLTLQEQPGRESFVDFPGGRVEQGETHEACALRELHEETGYRASELLPIWRYGHKGSSRFEKSFFLAKGLSQDINHLDEGEKISIIRESFDSAVERCHKYELRQFDAMLCLMNMRYDRELSSKVKVWLST